MQSRTLRYLPTILHDSDLAKTVMSRAVSRTGDRQRSRDDTVIPQDTRATDSATQNTIRAHDPHTRSAASTLQSCTVASWEASVRMPPDNSEAIRTAVVQSPVAAASLMPRDVELSSARSIDDHAREGAGRKVAVPATTGAPEGVRRLQKPSASKTGICTCSPKQSAKRLETDENFRNKSPKSQPASEIFYQPFSTTRC